MVSKNIGPFTLYTKKPNAIAWGHLYTLQVTLSVPNCKKRMVRVFLPEGYDPNERYPVLYMLDGQNIVDVYTTAYGEWNIDVSQKELVKQGYPPFIVVGVDCPNEPKHGPMYRVLEYTLNVKPSGRFSKRKTPEPYSDIYMDYLVHEIKPLIDENFATLTEKEFTGIGGSSMGGLASFNFATSYKDVFGFCLSFSPAFYIYDQEDLKRYINNLNINPDEYGKFFFYSGGTNFEKAFLRGTVKMYYHFLNCGFDQSQVALFVDSRQNHCEAAWEKYFPEAIKFWLGDN